MENEILEIETTETTETIDNEIIAECNCIDYSQQYETIIQQNNELIVLNEKMMTMQYFLLFMIIVFTFLRIINSIFRSFM